MQFEKWEEEIGETIITKLDYKWNLLSENAKEIYKIISNRMFLSTNSTTDPLQIKLSKSELTKETKLTMREVEDALIELYNNRFI